MEEQEQDWVSYKGETVFTILKDRKYRYMAPVSGEGFYIRSLSY